ncbi:hypothetical protein MACH26_39710 [Planctobacterium marinum]|uniref:Uncharacterized protein n=1 Tax=Planctobacterium marinum TaxID=1631968 RepID=A0AA48KWD9_9ALTE|nr:hypothetical protein MACH26_39710 [Planctobacterium marinum]
MNVAVAVLQPLRFEIPNTKALYAISNAVSAIVNWDITFYSVTDSGWLSEKARKLFLIEVG